ncbi:MAG: T9SS type A sorting domain-containing protein [Calditrichaeota bacterium]|nr:T9SS type A sorting domain-containing protein [Calditrichota bacterium]
MKYLGTLFFLFIFSVSMALANSFVGPEKCLTCHNNPTLGDATGWRTSMHANGYSIVLDDSRSMETLYGIIADYDENGVDDFHDGLDFNKITSAFDKYKPNAPILGYSAENGYTITIGDVTHRVYLTYGGSGLYKQRFGVKINTSEGESEGIYISPVQFNEKTHEYVVYHGDAWYDESNKPKFTSSSTLTDAASNSRSLAKNCSGCHVTGLTLDQNASGEWIAHGAEIDPATVDSYTDNNVFDIDGDGDLDQINVGCESCHGPGGDHVAGPSKANIINPEDLTADQANNLCGMCHSRGKSLPNNTFGFPYHDDTMTGWSPGDMVADIYSDGGGYWGDGINSKKHHQQFYDFYKSPKPTFAYHQVTCFECHDVHNSQKHHIVEDMVEEDVNNNPITIATENDNNTLCLACHATHGPFAEISKEMVADYASNETAIADIVTKHTRHSWDPTNKNETNGASRCSKCHQPKIAKSAIAYDIHSHTFEPISPEKTLEYAMPNACAVSCHNKNDFTFGVDMSADTFTDWNEDTDKNLAEELLFWYENMWFHETNEEGNVVAAKQVATPPTVDGDDSDAAWAGIDYVSVPLAKEKSIDIKATYTDTDLYLLFKWEDSTASFTRGGAWVYNSGSWSNTSGQNEDRIALMWNMTVPAEEWADQGCMNKCHRNVDNKNVDQDKTTSEDDAYLPDGQKADMWHMKAARSLGAISASGSDLTVDPNTHEVKGGTVTMSGYMDDKYIGPFDPANAPDGGRYGDAGSSTYSRNRNSEKTGPKYIETNPTDFMDAMILHQSEIDNGEAVEVASLSSADLQTAWDKYAALNAVVPERVLHAPDGSRGDVMQAAKWANGYWTAEIKRALNTGHADDDAIFELNNSYTFGIAIIDNGGGEDHWTQGSALTTLNLGSTGIAQGSKNVPFKFELAQNFPNPFNPTTKIPFSVQKAERVVIEVYNIKGQKIRTLLNEVKQPGTYQINFNGNDLASGVYLIQMHTSSFMSSKKMILLK